jgi:NADPH:quinone reductase-like Zn-dependent oxidoreductase
VANALRLHGFGDPARVVALAAEPELHPGRGELLVALEAAPVHPSDLHLIRGFYGVHPELPAPLGAEGVGRVVEVGPGADQDLAGRRVVILPTYTHGTWADQALVADHDVLAVSDHGDPLQLAMVGVNPLTALLLLRVHERLSPGEWIAQTGANSAVGQYVIKLASLAGVKTLNLVRREAAEAQVLAAGGDRVAVVHDDLPEQLERALDGHELALVLDSVGGPAVAELAHRLRFGGKVVSFGALAGEPTALSVRRDLVYRHISHHGFWTLNWLRQASREDITAHYREIAGLVAGGKLTAEIDRTYPLEQYAEALNHAEAYQRKGKVMFVSERSDQGTPRVHTPNHAAEKESRR